MVLFVLLYDLVRYHDTIQYVGVGLLITRRLFQYLRLKIGVTTLPISADFSLVNIDEVCYGDGVLSRLRKRNS